MSNQVLIVARGDLKNCDVVSFQPPSSAEGGALLQIETFGLSANNITYLALGDAMPYREFFPVPDESLAAEWCCAPVWGVARVVESNTAILNVGDRVYGLFPAARFATLSPSDVTPGGFRVERPHVPDKFAFYHQYGVHGRDPFYLPDREAMMAVMRPLFLTGVLLDDYLREIDFAGTRRVIVSSSASKTAFGFATAVRGSGGVELVGLASAASREFAEGYRLYDRVVTYEEIPSLEDDLPAIYVDISGSVGIRRRLGDHLGHRLQRIVSVGLTHWTDGEHGGGANAEGARSQVFFAPGWSAQRFKERGPAFLGELLVAWKAQMESVGRFFGIVHEEGRDAVRGAWLSSAKGSMNPSQALVLNL